MKPQQKNRTKINFEQVNLGEKKFILDEKEQAHTHQLQTFIVYTSLPVFLVSVLLTLGFLIYLVIFREAKLSEDLVKWLGGVSVGGTGNTDGNCLQKRV